MRFNSLRQLAVKVNDTTDVDVELDYPRIEQDTGFYRFVTAGGSQFTASLMYPLWTDDGQRLRLFFQSGSLGGGGGSAGEAIGLLLILTKAS